MSEMSNVGRIGYSVIVFARVGTKDGTNGSSALGMRCTGLNHTRMNSSAV